MSRGRRTTRKRRWRERKRRRRRRERRQARVCSTIQLGDAWGNAGKLYHMRCKGQGEIMEAAYLYFKVTKMPIIEKKL